MRDYARVSPRFWTGHSGRRIIREGGKDAVIVALYLMTCPSANMIGLYYLPVPTIAHETRVSEGVSRPLSRGSEGGPEPLVCPCEGVWGSLAFFDAIGFAHYDDAVDYVWIPEMAMFQVGPSLNPGDVNMIKGVQRLMEQARKCRFVQSFHAKYQDAYHLPPSEGGPKPLRPPLRRRSRRASKGGTNPGAGTGEQEQKETSELRRYSPPAHAREGDGLTW